MSCFLIENATLVVPGESSALGSLLIKDSKIAALNPDPESLDDECVRIDADRCLLTPGLIDIHTHGILHYLYEAGAQQIQDASSALPTFGTTCVIPTLYSVMNRKSLDRLETLSLSLSRVSGAEMPGFHLEGPFLALPGAGAETIPGDLPLLKEILAATHGRTLAMSVSPDTPNVIPVIEHLRKERIVVFLTHTCASPEQTKAAIDAGARHATHFYDVFPVPKETDPGVRPVGAVEEILADSRCSVDFICDGVHVHRAAIRASLAAKGWDKILAITDSNIGAGLPEGIYDMPWGYSVKVSPTRATRVADEDHDLHGTLAGSSLTMDRAVCNLFDWLDIPEHQIWAMATRNPATLLGLQGKGGLKVGGDADLVLWDYSNERLRVNKTWVAGKCIFDSDVHANS